MLDHADYAMLPDNTMPSINLQGISTAHPCFVLVWLSPSLFRFGMAIAVLAVPLLLPMVSQVKFFWVV